MREAEEEAAQEAEQKKLDSTVNAPQIDTVSDEKLLEELRQRAEAKQVN